jgi:uncharacterized repeat protein (TIGR02543 family)
MMRTRFPRAMAIILAFVMAVGLLPMGVLAADPAAPATYTVTFDANGGDGTVPDPQTADIGSSITLPAGSGITAPTGMTFVGWSANAQANGNGQYKNSNSVIYAADETYQASVNTKLYAIWASAYTTTAKFFIRLDGVIPHEPGQHRDSNWTAGVEISGAIKAGMAYFYADTTKRTAPDKSGVESRLTELPTDNQIQAQCSYDPATQYILWYVIKHETGGIWHVDGVLLDKAKANLLYAPNAPEGTYSSLPDGEQVALDQNTGEGTTAVSDVVPTRGGYAFTGWNTKADGSGTAYAPSTTTVEDEITNPTPITITGDTTLYAQWANISNVTYKITNDAASTPGGSAVPAAATAPSGTVQTVAGVPTTTWTTSDGTESGVPGTWTFSGWSTTDATVNKDGTFTMPDNDVVLTGSWTFTADTYTVTYAVTGDAKYGVPEDSKTPSTVTGIPYGGNAEVAAVPTTAWKTSNGTKTGVPGTWTFSGWGPAAAGQTIGNITANMTETGSWTFKRAAVIIIPPDKDNGGDNPTPTPTPTPSATPTPTTTPTVPKDLNSVDHILYIVGYPDGSVRPNGNITRAEVTSAFYRLLTAQRRDAIFTSANSYTDVSASRWFNKAVSSMTNGKYVTGYPDGSFGGNRPITRAEFVAIAARFMAAQSGNVSFTDVSADNWAYQYISTAVSYGWVNGYPDGAFRPNQPITRAEAMTIINRMLNRGVDAGGVLPGIIVWPDNPKDAWYYFEVVEATNHHAYTGARPSETWTSLQINYFYDIVKYENP